MAFSPIPTLLMASGIKCKKAPPIKAPAEKATSQGKILFKIFSFKTKVKAPTKEISADKNRRQNYPKKSYHIVFLFYLAYPKLASAVRLKKSPEGRFA